MAQKYEASVERLPEHIQSSARRYVEDGIMPGGFLRKALQNDFVGAVGHADGTNSQHLDDVAMWLFNDIPSGAWGDQETVREWSEQGGLNG